MKKPPTAATNSDGIGDRTPSRCQSTPSGISSSRISSTNPSRSCSSLISSPLSSDDVSGDAPQWGEALRLVVPAAATDDQAEQEADAGRDHHRLGRVVPHVEADLPRDVAGLGADLGVGLLGGLRHVAVGLASPLGAAADLLRGALGAAADVVGNLLVAVLDLLGHLLVLILGLIAQLLEPLAGRVHAVGDRFVCRFGTVFQIRLDILEIRHDWPP